MAITNTALIELFKSGKQKRYSAGELVLRGEAPSGVIMIQDGLIRVYSISDEGNRYVHVLYKAGELFPLIWAMQDIRRRIFYEAATEVTVYEAARSEFLQLIKSDALASYDVLAQLAGQFYIFADSLDNLQYKSAHERVAYRLVFLASRFGVVDGNKIIIKAPLTHEFISESINLARETVSREMENLEKKNLVGREHGLIVIKDIKRMSEEFSEPITMDLWGLAKTE